MEEERDSLFDVVRSVLAPQEHNVSFIHPKSTFTHFRLAQWWWGDAIWMVMD